MLRRQFDQYLHGRSLSQVLGSTKTKLSRFDQEIKSYCKQPPPILFLVTYALPNRLSPKGGNRRTISSLEF
jgi:hypothetical protein